MRGNRRYSVLAIAASIPTVVLCVLAAAVLWPIVAHAALALDVFVLVRVLAWCRAPISDRAVPVASLAAPLRCCPVASCLRHSRALDGSSSTPLGRHCSWPHPRGMCTAQRPFASALRLHFCQMTRSLPSGCNEQSFSCPELRTKVFTCFEQYSAQPRHSRVRL